jgi:hypothetical protein
MVWNVLAAIAINLVLSWLLRPGPQAQPPPAGLDEVDVPTAEEGGAIPVLFGRRHLRAPNVVWYGDLRAVPIKSKTGKK